MCRQLGFPGYERSTHSATFGPSKRKTKNHNRIIEPPDFFNFPPLTGKFWMDNLYCTGRERNLTDCHFDGWGNHDCEPTEIAGVVCKLPVKTSRVLAKESKVDKIKAHAKNRIQGQFQVRLAKGRTATEGRIEVSK